MMWRVYASKTKKTRKIPIRPEIAELTRQLMKTAPKGSTQPIFRNTKGKLWKRMTGVVRFIGLKKKLGWDQDGTGREAFPAIPVDTRMSIACCRVIGRTASGARLKRLPN
ncbi:MAG: hypothetical protein U0941_26845 [Planctomycetaceae bacterium]